MRRAVFPDYTGFSGRYDTVARACGFWRVPGTLADFFIKAAGPLPREMRILDLGIGTGALAKALLARQNDLHIVGLEPCPVMRAQCLHTLGDIDDPPALVGGGYQKRRFLPFASRSFDLIASCGVFEWLDLSCDDFREMLRVVRPGGHLAFTFQMHEGGRNRRELGVHSSQKAPLFSYQMPFIEQMVTDAGANVMRTHAMIAYCMPYPKHYGFVAAVKPS